MARQIAGRRKGCWCCHPCERPIATSRIETPSAGPRQLPGQASHKVGQSPGRVFPSLRSFAPLRLCVKLFFVNLGKTGCNEWKGSCREAHSTIPLACPRVQSHFCPLESFGTLALRVLGKNRDSPLDAPHQPHCKTPGFLGKTMFGGSAFVARKTPNRCFPRRKLAASKFLLWLVASTPPSRIVLSCYEGTI